VEVVEDTLRLLLAGCAMTCGVLEEVEEDSQALFVALQRHSFRLLCSKLRSLRLLSHHSRCKRLRRNLPRLPVRGLHHRLRLW
jgi:hypothetical protein